MTESDYIASRSRAKELGVKTYFTGNPCPRGHITDRYTTSGGCVVCSKAQSASRNDYYRQRYQEKREEILRKHRKRYAENEAVRIAVNENQKRWNAENKERVRDIKRSYRARRRAAERDGMTGPEFSEWVSQQVKVCHWCGVGCEESYHADHYVPLSKGGKHEVGNLVISCPSCNVRKNAKHPADFAASIGRLI